jgi:hypothetical protein
VENAKARIQELERELEDLRQKAEHTEASLGADRQRTGDVLVRTRKALEVAQKLLS